MHELQFDLQDVFTSKSVVPPVRTIATLDSETLGLHPRSIVWEIAVLKTEVDPYYKPVAPVEIFLWHLEMFPQLRVNRLIETQALEFAVRKYGDEQAKKFIMGDQDRVHPKLALATMQRVLANCEEVWINKTSFDHSVLFSLAEDMGVTGDLWPHRSELDIRTAYRILKIRKAKEKADHRAVADCQDNLETLIRMGMTLKFFEACVAEEEARAQKQRDEEEGS